MCSTLFCSLSHVELFKEKNYLFLKSWGHRVTDFSAVEEAVFASRRTRFSYTVGKTIAPLDTDTFLTEKNPARKKGFKQLFMSMGLFFKILIKIQGDWPQQHEQGSKISLRSWEIVEIVLIRISKGRDCIGRRIDPFKTVCTDHIKLMYVCARVLENCRSIFILYCIRERPAWSWKYTAELQKWLI